MLALTGKAGEVIRIHIPTRETITIRANKTGRQVKLKIEAPEGFWIVREEIELKRESTS